jgi:membrane fusion protein (multidrug efflux system)
MAQKKNMLLSALFVLLASCGASEQGGMEPPEIPVFETKPVDVPVYQEFVGQIYGLKDIAIRARVEGYLEEIHFREGSRVKQGDLLYVLESQPFEAEVAARMSGVAEAKTVLAKAESDLNRIRPLAEQRAVSESDLDAAVAYFEAAEASVEAAEANLRAARIQLSYTRIHSPISGIIGKTRAKVGDFVGRNPNPVILNVVSRIDTILVQFFITETQYLQLARYGLMQGAVDRPDSTKTPLSLILADGSTYGQMGRVDFIDRGVDPTTGAILLQASFPNPDELLRSGQFARVRGLVRVVRDGILVPQRSISELQGLFRVYVVGENDTVTLREIAVGPTVGSFRLVRDGLEAGERIVYEGVQRMREGMTIHPKIVEIELPVE